MLRVAILLGDFSIGGAQRVVCELVKNIDQSKVEILVLCTKERDDTAMADSVEKIATVKYANIKGRNLIINYFKISKILADFKPDILHAHLLGQLYAVPWGLIHNKPVIITAHTKPEKAFIKKIEWMIRFGIKQKKIFIVAVSKENLGLVKKYFEIDDKRCCYINNGIDVNRFYKKNHSHFTFINVARQDENKNQLAIIRCFEKIYRINSNIRLILVGDGPSHQKLSEEVNRLKLNDVALLPGEVSNVEDYYAISDVYVQSSHREALPMSILEAMAAGLPIISTDVGGIRDVVSGNGFLIKDEQVELFKAMRLILEKTDNEKNNMGFISKKLSNKYSSKTMGKEYTSLYFELRSKRHDSHK